MGLLAKDIDLLLEATIDLEEEFEYEFLLEDIDIDLLLANTENW
ncbi:hypothetical protein [Bacillus suaedaesalsae]|nr:hypothetical protein [Bacillus suaedaesalsae]